MALLVPTTAATYTLFSGVPNPVFELKHCTVEPEVHDVVVHAL